MAVAGHTPPCNTLAEDDLASRRPVAPGLPLERSTMNRHQMVRASAPPGSSRRRMGGRGFTLIEIVIVIVVIGLILRFGLPSFSRSLRVGRVNRAVTVLSADIERAF